MIKRIFSLAWPFFIAQAMTSGMMLTDTWMAGQAGTLDLAAVAVGSNLALIAIMVLYGFLMVLSPRVAYLKVSEPQNIHNYFLSAQTLAVLISLIIVLLLGVLIWALPAILNQTPQIVPEAQRYLLWSLPGILFASIYLTHRFTWEGLHYVRWTLFISTLTFLLNIPLDALFVLGLGQWSGLGGEGCGIASSFSFLISAVLAYRFLNRHPALLSHKRCTIKICMGHWPRLLRLGLPAAFALLSEVVLFMLLALLIAKFGVTQLAAHQITINLTSVIYVLPFSLATALSIEIGRALGEGDQYKLQELIRLGKRLALFTGILLAVAVFTLHQVLPAFFTTEKAVAMLSAHLLLYASVYQIADALQMTYAAILRGLGETLTVFKTTLFAYWGVGLAGGYFLANHWQMQAEGYWAALVLALGLNALLLGLHTRKFVKHLLNRPNCGTDDRVHTPQARPPAQ